MPKLSDDRHPAYCLHKQSGQARVFVDGRDILLGTYGTAASRKKYDRIIAEWIANGRRLPPAGDVTILHLISGFLKHAEKYYRTPEGKVAPEVEMYKQALRHVKALYGRTPAAEFGPLALKAVREKMIAPRKVEDAETKKIMEMPGWSRSHTNRQVGRIKAVFKWAVAEQMIPPAVLDALKAVDGLRKGRCDARETAPIKPVPEANVTATLPFLSTPIKTVVQLQLLTGARGGELLSMRGCDIDMTRDVWLYRPPLHKNAFKDLPREIRFGPQAQQLIRPFLKLDPQAFLFSPVDAVAEMREKRREKAKQPTRPGYGPGDRPTRSRPKRTAGNRYTSRAYAHAIMRAAEKAGVPHWHPHQIRHTFGTNIRAAYGFEAANILLGHESDEATGIYAEKDRKVAEKIMAEVG